MNGLLIVPFSALVVEVIAGCGLIVQMARRHGTLFNVPSALIAMYLVVVPVSGATHLLNVRGATRGFFDMLQEGTALPTELLVAVLLSWLGLACLWIGSMFVRVRANGAPIVSSPRVTPEPLSARWWFAIGLVLLVPTLVALSQISTLRASIDSTRVWGFADGNARLVFLASWVPWAIVLLAVALSRALRSPVAQLSILTLSALAIYVAASWGGSRSVALVYALPLFLLIFPRLRGLRAVTVIAVVLAVAYALIIGTDQRTATYRVQGVNLPGIIDWEWGRFSMVGFAAKFVSQTGPLYGETYFQSILEVPLSILKFVGIDLGVNLPSISEVTAANLLGSPTLNYTVPGALAESYMNGGVVGVVAIFLALGAIAAWVDRFARSPLGSAQRLFAYYLVSLLVLRVLVAESVSIPTYIFFTGLPLLVLALVERRLQNGKVATSRLAVSTIGHNAI